VLVVLAMLAVLAVLGKRFVLISLVGGAVGAGLFAPVGGAVGAGLLKDNEDIVRFLSFISVGRTLRVVQPATAQAAHSTHSTQSYLPSRHLQPSK
jgi:hypothetical protein